MTSGADVLGQQLYATAAGTSWALLALSFVPAGLVALAVAQKSKTVAALAQLSGLQEREAQRELLAKNALELDKLWFVLSVSNLGLTAFVIGASPRAYFLLFTPKTVCLIALRWWSFQKRGQHFLLWDFCYWANGLCLWYCWVRPRDAVLFQVVFFARERTAPCARTKLTEPPPFSLSRSCSCARTARSRGRCSRSTTR